MASATLVIVFASDMSGLRITVMRFSNAETIFLVIADIELLMLTFCADASFVGGFLFFFFSIEPFVRVYIPRPVDMQLLKPLRPGDFHLLKHLLCGLKSSLNPSLLWRIRLATEVKVV